MSLGKYLKTVRHDRGLSQWELSKLSGLKRSHISRLELDDYKNPKAETFLNLARALKIHPNELYEAAGYIGESARFRRGPPKTLEEAVAGLEVPLVRVPVTADASQLKTGESDVEHPTTWNLFNNKESIKGLLVRGFSLPPDILEGDIILIDPEVTPEDGNIVLCYSGVGFCLARYHSIPLAEGAGNGLQIYGTIIGINRRLT